MAAAGFSSMILTGRISCSSMNIFTAKLERASALITKQAGQGSLRNCCNSAVGSPDSDPSVREYTQSQMQHHHHDHDHEHQAVPSDISLRVKSLESLLVEKGLVDPAALDVLIDTYEHKVGPRNGARVVARAWVDLDFKKRLLTDGTAAIAELGYGGPQDLHLRVVENAPKVQNLVVCTLCSCYPWSLLGLPPVW